MRVVTVDPASGEIWSLFDAPESQMPGQPFEEGAKKVVLKDDEDVKRSTHYYHVETDTFAERTAMHPSHHVSGLSVVFAGIPTGTVIRVMDQELIADGDDEIAFDVPGTYRIELRHLHYLDETLEVPVG